MYGKKKAPQTDSHSWEAIKKLMGYKWYLVHSVDVKHLRISVGVSGETTEMRVTVETIEGNILKAERFYRKRIDLKQDEDGNDIEVVRFEIKQVAMGDDLSRKMHDAIQKALLEADAIASRDTRISGLRKLMKVRKILKGDDDES